LPGGYGAVSISALIGFLFGMWLEYSPNGGSVNLLTILGYLILAVSVAQVLVGQRRKVIKGVAGGALFGIGVGISLASLPAFQSFLQSLGF
jgi:hypothetical protein